MESIIMDKKSIFKKSYVEIFYDATDKIIIARWIGFLKIDDLKVGCGELTSFIKKNNVKKHLSDHSQLKVLSKDVQEYLGKHWFPEVERSGLRKIAALVSEDVFAQATVNTVNKASVGKLQINTYPSEKQCLNWLNE